MASTSVSVMTLMGTVVLGACCIYQPQRIINITFKVKLCSDLGERGADRAVVWQCLVIQRASAHRSLVTPGKTQLGMSGAFTNKETR